MKARIIKQILRRRFNEFCESIEDPQLKRMVEKNSMITGGSIASMLLNEKVNDFDVYFTNRETTEAVARHYIEKFKETHQGYAEAKVVIGTGEEGSDIYKPAYDDDRIWIYVPSSGVAGSPQPGIAGETLGDDLEDEPEEQSEDDKKYQPVFLSPNAITLSGKMQLIIRFYGDPDKIHEYYDFAHCTNYWLSKNGEIHLRPQALEALLTKELLYIGSKYPVCSIIRTKKFIKRGFSITAGQYLKMILQCNELDLFDLDVLEDQLVGVDSAYFMQVIDVVKSKSPEKVNAAYLSEIIDRIFCA